MHEEQMLCRSFSKAVVSADSDQNTDPNIHSYTDDCKNELIL